MNILLIIFAVLLIINVVGGYKKGLVKSLVSFISLIVLVIVGVLVVNGIHSYIDGRIANLLLLLVALIGVSVAHRLINVALFPAKLVSKLPVVSWLNQLLGIVFGVLQTLIIAWTLYAFVLLMDLGVIEQLIVTATQESEILTQLYNHNLLLGLLQSLVSSL